MLSVGQVNYLSISLKSLTQVLSYHMRIEGGVTVTFTQNLISHTYIIADQTTFISLVTKGKTDLGLGKIFWLRKAMMPINPNIR